MTANALTFSEVKFGTKQMGDAQWSPSACITTTTCTSSAQNVGSFRNGNGQNFTLGATQYIKFSYTNTDPAEPWTITAYNANGTVATVLGTYRIINAGQGYFMTSNAPHPQAGNGTLWSTQTGMVSGAKTYTEILQPTPAQMDELANLYYSPNAIYTAGAVYTPPPPPPPPYSSGITAAQQTSKTANTLLRQQQSGNEIDIEQIGDNNSITVRQGSSLTGKNRMTVYANGDNNSLNLNQGYLTDGVVSANDSNDHYLNLNLSGNSNNITTRQTGSGQYNETTVTGNTNVLNLQQQGTTGKTLFTNVNGANNTVIVNQKDTGQHYLDVKLTGNGHSVNATQEGSGNHKATIDLANTGGSSTLNLNQLGTTDQIYSIQQSCATPTGCSTTIVQGQ